MAEILGHIYRRRSIRKFTSQKVADEVIVSLLKAAMAAPSATNARPWEFVVVTDEDRLKKLEANLPFGRHGAPLMIVPLGNPALALNRAAQKFWQQDLSAATENILIAAAGMGLGGCWIGVYPIHWLVKRISAVLGLPEGVFPLCVINLGYPATRKSPRTQYDERRVHWQVYDQAKSEALHPKFFERAAALLGVAWDYIRPLNKDKQ